MNFKYFLKTIASHSPDELKLLFLYIDTNVVDIIQDCATYKHALAKLDAAYIKTPNEICARHLLSTRIQNPGETLDEFILALNTLASDENRNASIRDSFIRGLQSLEIRARLLENSTLTLKTAINKAKALERTRNDAESYLTKTVTAAAVIPCADEESSLNIPPLLKANDTAAATHLGKNDIPCFFCGLKRHPRTNCPVRDALCYKCGKKDTGRRSVVQNKN